MNANLIFKWVRDPRYRSSAVNEPKALSFLPVEVMSGFPTPDLAAVEPVQELLAVSGSIKIVLVNGHHMDIFGAFYTDIRR